MYTQQDRVDYALSLGGGVSRARSAWAWHNLSLESELCHTTSVCDEDMKVTD